MLEISSLRRDTRFKIQDVLLIVPKHVINRFLSSSMFSTRVENPIASILIKGFGYTVSKCICTWMLKYGSAL